jgi:hypothetical protein
LPTCQMSEECYPISLFTQLVDKKHISLQSHILFIDHGFLWEHISVKLFSCKSFFEHIFLFPFVYLSMLFPTILFLLLYIHAQQSSSDNQLVVHFLLFASFCFLFLSFFICYKSPLWFEDSTLSFTDPTKMKRQNWVSEQLEFPL